MEIDNKHINVIIESLKHSIRNCREWHQKEAAKYKEQNRVYDYDYESESIAPMQEALNAIKINKR